MAWTTLAEKVALEQTLEGSGDVSLVGFPEEALEWRVQKEQSSQKGEAKTEAAEGPEDLVPLR